MSLSWESQLTEIIQRTEQYLFAVTDPAGCLLEMNQYFSSHLEKTKDDKSSFITDFLSPAEADICQRQMEECILQEEPINLASLNWNFGSSTYKCNWELVRLPDANIGWAGTIIREVPSSITFPQLPELFFQNLVAHSLDGMLVTDREGTIRFASPSVTAILHLSQEDLLQRSAFSFVHPDDRELAMASFADEVQGTPKTHVIRVRLQKKDGSYVWCIVRGHNLYSNPYVDGIIIYFYDDTPRKKIEDQLLESERRFRNQATILQNSTDVIVMVNMDLVITSWNKVCEEISGIPAAEAIGQLYRDILPMDFSPYTREEVASQLYEQKVWKGEVSFLARDGERKHILHTVSVLEDEQGPIGILGVGKDITERKRMEAKIAESEFFYRNLISHSLDGIIMVDTSGVITYCGPSVTKISGYSTSHLLGHHFFEFVHPEDLAAAQDAFIHELNKSSTLNYLFMRLLHSDGGWRWCSVRGHNLFNTPGINAMVIYFTEQTRRKMIEDKLQQSEERFRYMINNLKVGVALHNDRGEMLVCNQAAMDLTGVPGEELTGSTWSNVDLEMIHEEGQPVLPGSHPVEQVVITGQPVKEVVIGLTHRISGERVWLLLNAEPIPDSEGRILSIICSMTDITEQRQFSQQLIELEMQKQKQLMQATIDAQERERKEIGRELHDNISQHITTTRLYLEVARDKAKGELNRLIGLAHKELLNTVNEMRKLSQALVPPSLSDVGLIESVEDLCSPLKTTHAFTISFRHSPFQEELLSDNLKLMLFRIIQEQVNNIIRHAKADTILIRLQTTASQVKLSITDNGVGFVMDAVKKGLGIVNMNSRVDLFGGKLKIESSPGNGCSLQVTIPLPGPPRRSKRAGINMEE